MRGVRAGLGVLVGLALVGCTGAAPEPDVGASSPRVSAEASVSASPSVPTKPKRPEAMDRDDAEGAAAAAVYFIELYPYVMATGDTAEFEAMSHRACGFCSGVLNDLARVQDNAQRYEGGAATGEVLVSYARDDVTGVYPFDVSIRQEVSSVVDEEGAVVSSAEAETVDVRVEVGRRSGSWVVIEVASVPEP